MRSSATSVLFGFTTSSASMRIRSSKSITPSCFFCSKTRAFINSMPCVTNLKVGICASPASLSAIASSIDFVNALMGARISFTPDLFRAYRRPSKNASASAGATRYSPLSIHARSQAFNAASSCGRSFLCAGVLISCSVNSASLSSISCKCSENRSSVVSGLSFNAASNASAMLFSSSIIGISVLFILLLNSDRNRSGTCHPA